MQRKRESFYLEKTIRGKSLLSRRLVVRFLTLTSIILFFTSAWGQPATIPPEWVRPMEPFRIVGNLYYVGTADLTSYLFVTPEGNILLDTGLQENVPQVQANIAKLGFNIKKIKILLNSHAHYDHAGGLNAVKQLTGAKLYASPADAQLMARGGKQDFAYADRVPYPPVKVDHILHDGEQVELGGTKLTAHFTPGHTKGCTTWTAEIRDQGKLYHLVFVCSTSFPSYKLVNNAAYPNIVSDYEHTFSVLQSLPCDIFLASHGSVFGLEQKAAEFRNSSTRNSRDLKTNPFVDPAGYKDYVARSKAAFEEELHKQQRSSH